MRLRSHKAFGNTTWRFVVTVIVVVTLVRLSYTLTWSRLRFGGLRVRMPNGFGFGSVGLCSCSIH